MKIRASLYENDSNLSTNAQSMANTAGSTLYSLSLNVSNGPYGTQTNVSAAISAMHTNYPSVKILGYVDSGGAPLPSGDTCSTTVPSSCDSISRHPTLCTTEAGGYWNHFARVLSDWDLSSSNCYTNYYGKLRRQTLYSTGCTDVQNYMYSQIDEWFTTLSADGIMIDNCYPGPVNNSGWSWSTSDSHYSFYKAICDHIHNSYTGKIVQLNCAGYVPPEQWFSLTQDASNPTQFFDALQVMETPYMGGSCNFPPHTLQGGPCNNATPPVPYTCSTVPSGNIVSLPSWITSGKYDKSLFTATLYCPSSVIGGSAVTTWFSDCCSNGIGDAFISSAGDCSGGSYTVIPSNWNTQVSAANSITSC